MLKEEGAKEGWFLSEGVHSFSYSDLGNAAHSYPSWNKDSPFLSLNSVARLVRESPPRFLEIASYALQVRRSSSD